MSNLEWSAGDLTGCADALDRITSEKSDALTLEDCVRVVLRQAIADGLVSSVTRERVAALAALEPDFGVDGIEVVGDMKDQEGGAYLLRSDVMALFVAEAE